MFGTLNLEELGELIELKQKEKKRVIKIREKEGEIVEGDEPLRTSYPNAWVNIHVRVRQLLFLLYRAVRPRPRTVPESPKISTPRSKGWWRKAIGKLLCWDKTSIPTVPTAGRQDVCRAVGCRGVRRGGFSAPFHDQPSQGLQRGRR